jgi:hypothetical protein
VSDNNGRPPAKRQGPTRDRNSIQDELVIFNHPTRGRTLAVLPVIPESAPWPVREGITRRRIVVVTGQCPCGARLDLQAAREGRVGVAGVEHEGRCPAATATLAKAVRRWSR